MLYHNIINRDDNRKVKQVVEGQEQNEFKNTFYQKKQEITKELQIDIRDVTSTSKSKWKKSERESNSQNKKKNERRYARKKSRTIQNGKWERKQYIKKSESSTIINVMKIRLHMLNTKCNYKRNKLEHIPFVEQKKTPQST